MIKKREVDILKEHKTSALIVPSAGSWNSDETRAYTYVYSAGLIADLLNPQIPEDTHE